ncbi:unnamed protein product [Phytophthora fragariaefolia]|uniref:Unnamed protein product n=1 Tax=Phytophthora fragariaefolia TaxID=1490495 RepID=A0A9W6XGM9_9STRA|nr:unnamed protein product [Phytophthora fragariaefolia]
MGKKVFDGIVRKWRQALHTYDPPELAEALKTAETESAGVGSRSDAGGADTPAGKSEQDAAPTSGSTSTESDVKKDESAGPTSSGATPPSRSIYENFDEDNFDDEDTDDDLL